LAPSSLGEDLVADPPPDPAMRVAAERGRLLHALFERLPAIAPVARGEAAERWLAGSGGVADARLRAELVRAALAVTEDPRFAELFGDGALAEAPIAAVVEGLVVAGTVDRLVVTPERVRVVDFKTGRRAPATLDDIPAYHLRQMAAYAAALGVIFPDRTVEAALLYSAGPVLHLLPPALLAAHKPGLSAPEQSLASRA
jgi:ATP-dependent helicase/nuclease subunit A